MRPFFSFSTPSRYSPSSFFLGSPVPYRSCNIFGFYSSRYWHFVEHLILRRKNGAQTKFSWLCNGLFCNGFFLSSSLVISGSLFVSLYISLPLFPAVYLLALQFWLSCPTLLLSFVTSRSLFPFLSLFFQPPHSPRFRHSSIRSSLLSFTFLHSLTLLHTRSLSLALLCSHSLSYTLLYLPHSFTLLNSPSLSYTLIHSPPLSTLSCTLCSSPCRFSHPIRRQRLVDSRLQALQTANTTPADTGVAAAEPTVAPVDADAASRMQDTGGARPTGAYRLSPEQQAVVTAAAKGKNIFLTGAHSQPDPCCRFIRYCPMIVANWFGVSYTVFGWRRIAVAK